MGLETTRHFTATVYLVNDGATLLHRHDRLGIHVPPGGHLDRDELPHEAGLREVHEETGIEADLLTADRPAPVDAPAGEELPRPRHQMLYDINVHPDGEVGHQHIDFVYFAAAPTREVDPEGEDEADADAWSWYAPAGLRRSDIDRDTVAIGIEAIEAVGAHAGTGSEA
jgi:ADP-ribose pyrophosphatase YjhB (NUDIX family)